MQFSDRIGLARSDEQYRSTRRIFKLNQIVCIGQPSNTDSYRLANNIKFVGACFSGISNWSVFPQSLKRPFAKNWNKPYFFLKKCTIKLNARYMLQTANVSNQTWHGRSVVVFAVKCSKNDICVKIYYYMYIGNDCRELLSFKMGFGKRN